MRARELKPFAVEMQVLNRSTRLSPTFLRCADLALGVSTRLMDFVLSPRLGGASGLPYDVDKNYYA